jgi:hypothetical protein
MNVWKSFVILFFFMQKHDGHAWPVVDHNDDKDIINFVRWYSYLNTSRHTSNGLLYILGEKKENVLNR